MTHQFAFVKILNSTITIFVIFRNITLRSINFSKCTALYKSGYTIGTTLYTLVSFCTIENTTSNVKIVIEHNSPGKQHTSFCNILNNIQRVLDEWIMRCKDDLEIKYCFVFWYAGPEGFKLFTVLINTDSKFMVKIVMLRVMDQFQMILLLIILKWWKEFKYISFVYILMRSFAFIIDKVKDIINEVDDTFYYTKNPSIR